MEEKKQPEISEQQRKGISRYRLSWLFIILSIIALAYFIFEIVILATK